MVASVKGLRPERAYSSVEMLIFAWSASVCRETRRRASASRTVAATALLCVSDKSLSCEDIALPTPRSAQILTYPHRSVGDKSGVAASVRIMPEQDQR